jgi:hypothetical protein
MAEHSLAEAAPRLSSLRGRGGEGASGAAATIDSRVSDRLERAAGWLVEGGGGSSSSGRGDGGHNATCHTLDALSSSLMPQDLPAAPADGGGAQAVGRGSWRGAKSGCGGDGVTRGAPDGLGLHGR